MRFTGADTEIDLSGRNGAPPEFSDWIWADLATAAEWVVPFKRAIYRAVVAGFADFTEQLNVHSPKMQWP